MDKEYTLVPRNINIKSVNKQYLLIKKEIDVSRTIRKPKRQECGFGINAFYRDRDRKDD